MDDVGRRVRVLCLDGGGTLGLATAAFLAAVEEREGLRLAEHFDLFCGTSTGGILALGLADGKSAAELVELYQEMSALVFPSGWPRLRKFRQLFTAKYSAAPLERVLEEHFGDVTLGDLQRRGKAVSITAFDELTGAPRVFKTNHGPGLVRDANLKLRDVARATSAAPTYLPAAILDLDDGSRGRFVDGGLFANDPTMVGYIEATVFMERAPAEVQLLSISTPTAPLARVRSVRRGVRFDDGALAWALWAPTVAIGSASRVHQLSVQLLQRAPHARLGEFHRVELPNPAHLVMDASRPDQLASLRTIGTAAAHDKAQLDALRPFFTTSKETSHG